MAYCSMELVVVKTSSGLSTMGTCHNWLLLSLHPQSTVLPPFTTSTSSGPNVTLHPTLQSSVTATRF
eukprot:1711024-Ditylum_brightwellii.AAC.2